MCPELENKDHSYDRKNFNSNKIQKHTNLIKIK
jgi:hypothetical protein